ncbi:MAG: 50S ribosomal protein L3 [Candidatus Micrarchaeota archaeon]|nr:50S ribosomal protein L3 [Candidatus Micrarchaeota archaeon]
MAKRVGPRRGSRAVRPRKRAKNLNVRINDVPHIDEVRFLNFVGFKVGMSQVSFVETRESPSKGSEISKAVTLVEVPKSVCFGLRFLRHKQVVKDVIIKDEKILKPLGIKNVDNSSLPESYDEVRLLVYCAVGDTTIGQKKPVVYEILIGGKDAKKQYEFAKNYLGKEIKISDVFKKGEHVDVVAVTKGKGWQGVIKRFGVAKQRRKATGKVRHLGTLGPWHPAYVMYTVPMAGQTGFHKRTEQNKVILDIVNDKNEINKVKPFHKYGFIKNDFVVIEGSLQGTPKRLVKLKLSNRNATKKETIQIIDKLYTQVQNTG